MKRETGNDRQETRLEMKHKAKHELLDVPEMILEFSQRVLGGCWVIARDPDARGILRLDSSGCVNLKQHSNETFVFSDWTLHDRFRFRAIRTT